MTTTQEGIGAYFDWLVQHGDTHIKLEITGGIRTWRLLPSLRHQKVIDRIRANIELIPVQSSGFDCGCYHLSDVSLKFPDGSFKRPGIAIFCVEPPDIDEAWEQIPEAVIEIVSQDYEEKDLSINPLWYLSQGVKDVIVFGPRAEEVTHFRHDASTARYTSPLPSICSAVAAASCRNFSTEMIRS